MSDMLLAQRKSFVSMIDKSTSCLQNVPNVFLVPKNMIQHRTERNKRPLKTLLGV